MTSINGTWQPGIGDPTLLGWTTVAAYCMATWLCCRAFAADRSQGGAHRETGFWLLAALALGLLGINKQLDLQTALTTIGRALARSHGWYEQRHFLQMGFIAAVGLSCLGGLAGFVWLSWPLSPGRLLTVGGLIFLAGFVLIRSSSFHHVDLFLTQPALGLRWNWILELSGIGLSGAGAAVEQRGASKRRWPPAIQQHR